MDVDPRSEDSIGAGRVWRFHTLKVESLAKRRRKCSRHSERRRPCVDLFKLAEPHREPPVRPS